MNILSDDSRPFYYYPYRCLPSTQVRGRRPQHAEGFCGRPILRKSKESLPIQGSPCPKCGRRTRINSENVDLTGLGKEAQEKIESLMREGKMGFSHRGLMTSLHEHSLEEWKKENQAHKSKYSNISEEMITELEYVADGLEQFVKECEEKEAKGEYE